MGRELESVEDVVAQMKLLLKAIPPRPSASEVESARLAIREEERSLTTRLEELFAQACPHGVPPQVFRALQDMHESVIRTQSEVRRKEDVFVTHLEEKHRLFDELIRKAELALPIKPAAPDHDSLPIDALQLANEDGKLRRSASGPLTTIKEDGRPLLDPSSPKFKAEVGGLLARTQEEGKHLYDGRTPAVTEVTPAKEDPSPEAVVPLSSAEEELLGAKWPPQLLSILETADRDGKQPESLVFSNGGYTWIPESIGLLVNLTSLDLSGNQLTALPESIGALTRLTNLDVEANLLRSLPESLGLLTCLERLNIEKNSIEELPWTIGRCTALVELRADFNQLKALPEAIGQLKSLRHLSVHLNCLKTLPTTMASLTSLTELYVHFNHLDSLPENLCSLTNLTKLDASSNFADFRTLPSSIGNLQGLRELDLSFNHLTVLPDSFALLTNLRKLSLDGNPWRVPPMPVVAAGQTAVLEYMAEWKERDQDVQKKPTGWKAIVNALTCFMICSGPQPTEDAFAKITA